MEVKKRVLHCTSEQLHGRGLVLSADQQIPQISSPFPLENYPSSIVHNDMYNILLYNQENIHQSSNWAHLVPQYFKNSKKCHHPIKEDRIAVKAKTHKR